MIETKEQEHIHEYITSVLTYGIKVFYCPICQREFASFLDTERHIERYHTIYEVKEYCINQSNE